MPEIEDADVADQVLYEVRDGIARVTINLPDQGNALTQPMRDRLAELLEGASADLAVRVVVLGAAGERHFCTGANIGGPRPAPAERPAGAPDRAAGEAARLIKRGWQRLIASILDCEKPVIAAVNGTAAGGGAHLVLASDLVVMADSAKLIEVFVRRGIIPDAGGPYLLPRLVGLQRAKELMFLGDAVPAKEAHRIGLANRVVPAGELAPAVDELAERLAAAPTRAIAMTKWLLNRSFESGRHTAFEEEAYAQEHVTGTEDSQEGMLSFVEGRDPEFKGW